MAETVGVRGLRGILQTPAPGDTQASIAGALFVHCGSELNIQKPGPRCRSQTVATTHRGSPKATRSGLGIFWDVGPHLRPWQLLEHMMGQAHALSSSR